MREVAFESPPIEAPGRMAEHRHDDRQPDEEWQRTQDQSYCDNETP
jgi:hypothetical protein